MKFDNLEELKYCLKPGDYTYRQYWMHEYKSYLNILTFGLFGKNEVKYSTKSEYIDINKFQGLAVNKYGRGNL